MKQSIPFCDKREGPAPGGFLNHTWSWNLAHLADKVVLFWLQNTAFPINSELFRNEKQIIALHEFISPVFKWATFSCDV